METILSSQPTCQTPECIKYQGASKSQWQKEIKVYFDAKKKGQSEPHLVFHSIQFPQDPFAHT